MPFLLKKFVFNITFNLSLFLLLMIGIQNSQIKRKVNLIISESVPLPVSFVIGIGFISGSILGGILKTDLPNKQK